MGVKVVLCTARGPRATTPVHKYLKLDTLQINHNGALIMDPSHDQVHVHDPLPGELARQVVDLARSVADDLAVGVVDFDEFYVDKMHRLFELEPSIQLNGHKVRPMREVLKSSVTKIMVMGAPSDLGAVRQELHRSMAGQVSFAFSHMHLLQVVHTHVNKGTALAHVAEHYGVSAGQTMAIGDGPNDLPMLRWAGLSVAVRNAWDEVKSSVHFVVASNDEDGVSQAIKRYVLTR